MADYSINAVSRKVSYTGSAGVGPYAFSFEILTDDDIAVYFNETLLTKTTDYSVTINANGTGSVTLVVNVSGNIPATPDADDLVVILGAKDIERTTDFVTAGDLRAAALNEQLDALTIFMQQIKEEVDRSIKAPAFDPTGIDMVLPKKADRVNAFIAFDANGDVSAAVPTDDVTTLAEVATDIATLADIEDGTIATDAISDTAAIAANVTTVAGIAANVTAVANDQADIGIVASDLSGSDTIGTVAANISNVNAVAAIDSDVTAVAADATDIGTVATDLAGSDTIGTVAGIAANVTTVAGISTDVTAVAGDATDIGTVAADLAGSDTIGTVAGSIADVNTVAAGINGGLDEASAVSYLPSGTGAVQTDVQTKLREIVSRSDYSSDSNFINAALNKLAFVESDISIPITSSSGATTSLQNVLDGISQWVIASDATVTLSLSALEFTCSTIEFEHPYASRIKISGQALTSLASPTGLSVSSNGSGDHDCTYTSTAHGLSTGDYVRIRSMPNTVNNPVFEGVWKVTATPTVDTFTVKNTADPATISFSGSIIGAGVEIDKFNSVLSFPSLGSDDGVLVYGYGPEWENIAFVSDNTGDSVGMLLWYGAYTRLENCAFHGWSSHGLYAIYDGTADAQFVVCSACDEAGIYALNNSTFQIVSAISTGNGTAGVINAGSHIAGSGLLVAGNAGNGYFGGDGSTAVIQNTTAVKNGSYGISLEEASHADVKGASTEVRNNDGNRGISVTERSFADIGDAESSGHTFDIYADQFSSLIGTATFTTSSIVNGSTLNDDMARLNVSERFSIGGNAYADFFDIATLAHNFGTVAANSQVSTTLTMTGVTDVGTGVMINNNAPVAGLIYQAIADATNSITITCSNITGSPIAAGLRTYTVVALGQ